jgi:hypothetical protein
MQRSRSPSRADPTPVAPNVTSLQLENLPKQCPHLYTYRHGPTSDSRIWSSHWLLDDAVLCDPRGGGSSSLRLTSTGASSGTMMMVPSEAVPGGTPAASASSGASPGVAGNDGDLGHHDGGGAPGGGAGGNHGFGLPAWDEDVCSLNPLFGSSPVTVRFAEVVHWRQRVVYCRPDCTVDHIKWTMRHIVGQHVSTFRIGDGFSGHPLARHWHVTGHMANTWLLQEPRRVLIVLPSCM